MRRAEEAQKGITLRPKKNAKKDPGGNLETPDRCTWKARLEKSPACAKGTELSSGSAAKGGVEGAVKGAAKGDVKGMDAKKRNQLLTGLFKSKDVYSDELLAKFREAGLEFTNIDHQRNALGFLQSDIFSMMNGSMIILTLPTAVEHFSRLQSRSRMTRLQPRIRPQLHRCAAGQAKHGVHGGIPPFGKAHGRKATHALEYIK